MLTADSAEEKLDKFTRNATVGALAIGLFLGFWCGKLSQVPLINEYRKQIKLYENVIGEYEKMVRILKEKNGNRPNYLP